MKEKLKNMPYWVYDLLSLLSAIITIITAVVALMKAIVVVNVLENGTYIVDCNEALLIICIMLFFMSIVCTIKVRKYGKIVRNIRNSFSYNYYMFLHDFRNAYFDMLCERKNNNNSDKKNRIQVLTRDTQNFLVNVLDYLCSIMESNTGEKVSACIKLIENRGQVTNIDKDKATVITFCRSRNSDTDRKVNDERQASIKIKDNTDFYDILDEDSPNTDSYFYQTDLVQYDKLLKKAGKEYKNTTRNYDNYYRGTIVAPIRIARKHLHYVLEDNGYDVIGFLCIDSPSSNAFRDNVFDRKNYSNIVKAFAAEIYIILNKYNFYLDTACGGKRDGKNI